MTNELDIIRRYNVSPQYLEEMREEFTMRSYLKPRQYVNNSRYTKIRRLQDEETGKIYNENWIAQTIDKSSEDQFYVVTMSEEDRLDIISTSFYGTPKYWWVIAIANNIIDPFTLEIGTNLRIPPIISLYNKGGVLSSD